MSPRPSRPLPTSAAKAPARTQVVVSGARSDALATDLAAVGVPEAFATGAGFTGALHQTLLVAGRGAEPDRLLVGIGPAAEVDANRLRSAAGTAGRRVVGHAHVALELHLAAAPGVTTADAASAVAEGWVLGGYRFDAHRSAPPEPTLRSVVVVTGADRGGRVAVQRGVALAEAICTTRDLVNEPGGALVPEQLAARIRAIAAASGLKVRVDGPAAIARKGLGGVLGVSQGATNGPRFVELTYEPKGRASGHVALVGKGVTFDTGGYSLKPSDSMKGMNGDMGGAAAVVGAMSLLATLKAPVRVTGYVPLVENMIGPDAIRVGDVLTIRGGTTVEVLNTDAEGRLILADALRLACEAGPDAIIDLATLTGACMVALGTRVAGLFGEGDALIERLRTAAATHGELVWPMPIPDHVRGELDSDIADLKNISGGRYGGASVAAAFLRRFVDDGIPWAHLDIAGPSWHLDAPVGEIPRRGTGFAVRTLAEVLADWTPLAD